MYSLLTDAINNEGVVTCYRPYLDYESGETKLRRVDLRFDRSQLLHWTDEQFKEAMKMKLEELDREFERSRYEND